MGDEAHYFIVVLDTRVVAAYAYIAAHGTSLHTSLKTWYKHAHECTLHACHVLGPIDAFNDQNLLSTKCMGQRLYLALREFGNEMRRWARVSDVCRGM